MTKKAKPAPSVVENPHGAAAPPRESMAGARLVEAAELPPLVGAAAPVFAAPEAFVAAAATLQENPHELAAAPRESMAGAVLVDGPEREAVAETQPPRAEDEAAALVVLQENPHELAAAPRESMAGAVLEPEEAAHTSQLPPPGELPPAVRSLPRRPRLRATFSYDHQDQVVAELTLMSEKRELIHRLVLSPKPGSTIAKIFEALTAVVATAARDNGAFGELKE